ncbi:MAG: signal peptidase II [Pirellula sp.]
MEVATDLPESRQKNNATIPAGRYLLFGALAMIGGLVDLLSKESVFSWRGLPGELPPWWIVEPYFGIETAVNQGALFGMGQGKGWLFAIMSIAAALGIAIWLFVFQAAASKWLTVTMGLVMGGILGNLYDRLGVPDLPEPHSGGVRDWILFTYQGYVWPNFNIADSLLVTGAIMLAVHSVFLQKDRS